MKKGIDVSDNQGTIDWKKAAAAGVEFAILRSTRGSGKTDYQFLNNVAGCRENDIPFDVYKYVYALTETAAREEMKKVCELLLANDIYCTIWYDIEWNKLGALGKSAITKIVKAAEEVAGQYGFPFGIYCNTNWYKNIIDSTAFDNDFWMARYPSKETASLSDTPDGKKKPSVTQELFGWQWSSTGRVNGISGNVDLDLIYQERDSDEEETAVSYTNPYDEPAYTLYRGRLAMSAEYVKWLQYNLVTLGYMTETYTSSNGSTLYSIDGKYGALTDAAVYRFQQKHPETYTTAKPDRKVGPKCRAALKDELLKK